MSMYNTREETGNIELNASVTCSNEIRERESRTVDFNAQKLFPCAVTADSNKPRAAMCRTSEVIVLQSINE